MQPNAHRILTTGSEASVMNTILEKEGYHATSVANFENALENLTANPDYGLVIVTGMYPVLPADHMAQYLTGQLSAMDGLDFVQALRTHPESRDIPAILMTSIAPQPDKLAELQSAKTYHVRKPFNVADLHTLVSRLLGA